MTFHVKVTQDGPYYIGQLVELPAVITQASSREALLPMLQDAFDEYWRSFETEVSELSEGITPS
jgi:predicted RNase H-like HicB family nuclease